MAVFQEVCCTAYLDRLPCESVTSKMYSQNISSVYHAMLSGNFKAEMAVLVISSICLKFLKRLMNKNILNDDPYL